jgi:hypothetical protein
MQSSGPFARQNSPRQLRVQHMESALDEHLGDMRGFTEKFKCNNNNFPMEMSTPWLTPDSDRVLVISTVLGVNPPN